MKAAEEIEEGGFKNVPVVGSDDNHGRIHACNTQHQQRLLLQCLCRRFCLLRSSLTIILRDTQHVVHERHRECTTLIDADERRIHTVDDGAVRRPFSIQGAEEAFFGGRAGKEKREREDASVSLCVRKTSF